MVGAGDRVPSAWGSPSPSVTPTPPWLCWKQGRLAGANTVRPPELSGSVDVCASSTRRGHLKFGLTVSSVGRRPPSTGTLIEDWPWRRRWRRNLNTCWPAPSWPKWQSVARSPPPTGFRAIERSWGEATVMAPVAVGGPSLPFERGLGIPADLQDLHCGGWTGGEPGAAVLLRHQGRGGDRRHLVGGRDTTGVTGGGGSVAPTRGSSDGSPGTPARY